MVADKKIKELEKSAVEMTVTIAQKTVSEEYDKVVKKYQKTLQVKGFRKGKAPIAILEKKYGEAFKEESMYGMIEGSIEEVLKDIEDQYKPLPYSQPKLVDEENISCTVDADFSFAVSYDVYPKFEVPNYTGHNITIPSVSVDDEVVAEELKKLQEQNSMVIDKTGAIEKDDIVTIDYSELDEEGAVIEGSPREDFVFTVGTGYNFYKLDDDILGMVKDEEKVIEKSFGEDHDIPEYVGKTVKIKVSVKAVKVRDLPELDDEFAQDVSDDYKTLDDLKKATNEKLTETLDQKLRSIKAERLYDALLEDFTVEIPESMVQAELENSWRNFAQQSGMAEQQLLDILAYQEKGKADLLEEWRPQALKSIRVQMILEKAGEEEKVEVTDEDIADLMPQLEGIENKEQREYYTYLMKEEKKSQKVVDLLLEKNEFTAGDAVTYTDLMQNKLD